MQETKKIKEVTEKELIKFLWQYSHRDWDECEFGADVDNYPEALAMMLQAHFHIINKTP